MALRLSRYVGISAQLWLNLQSQYDLEVAGRRIGKTLERPSTPFHALTFPIRFPGEPVRVTATATIREHASTSETKSTLSSRSSSSAAKSALQTSRDGQLMSTTPRTVAVRYGRSNCSGLRGEIPGSIGSECELPGNRKSPLCPGLGMFRPLPFKIEILSE